MTILSPQNETPGQTHLRSQREFGQLLGRAGTITVTVIQGLAAGRDAVGVIDIILYDARDAGQLLRSEAGRLILLAVVVIQDNGQRLYRLDRGYEVQQDTLVVIVVRLLRALRIIDIRREEIATRTGDNLAATLQFVMVACRQ